MSDVASPLLEWLSANPEFAAIATFLISAAESVAIIGTIVPGTVMMTAIGALVGSGIIPFWSTLFFAILGAIVGDGISYWLGYYFKDRLHDIWPFRKHPQILLSGEKFFHKYGGMSVFIGRFVGPVRALVPLVAGMLRLKPVRFTIANVTSAILWAPAYMLPGFMLGAASMQLPSELAARVLMIAILCVLFVILCYWCIKKTLELINQEVEQFLSWIWNSFKKSKYFHIITTILKHHDPKKTHGQLTIAFYLIVSAVTFAYLANFISYKGSENATNNMLYHLFRSIRNPATDEIMLLITFLGSKYVLIPVAFILACWCFIYRYFRTAVHIVAMTIITGISIKYLKILIQSPRPWGVLGNNDASFSFPSGHTTLSFVFYFIIAIFLIKLFSVKRKNLFLAPAGIIVSLVAVSRLYFGVHWLTDIIGGALLGFTIVILITLSYNRAAEKPITHKKSFIITLVIALILSYSANVLIFTDKLKKDYKLIDWPIYTITFDAWWQQQGNYFPLYRKNRVGVSSNIFNVQWLGKMTKIKKTLLENGWQDPLHHDISSALYRITGIDSNQHLPLLSPLYLDKKPIMILTKVDPNTKKLIIMRFWASRFIINNTKERLWLGTVEYAPSTYSWLFHSKGKSRISPSAKLLFNNIPEKTNIKETSVTIKYKKKSINQVILLIKPSTIIGSRSIMAYPDLVLYKPKANVEHESSIDKEILQEYGLIS